MIRDPDPTPGGWHGRLLRAWALADDRPEDEAFEHFARSVFRTLGAHLDDAEQTYRSLFALGYQRALRDFALCAPEGRCPEEVGFLAATPARGAGPIGLAAEPFRLLPAGHRLPAAGKRPALGRMQPTRARTLLPLAEHAHIVEVRPGGAPRLQIAAAAAAETCFDGYGLLIRGLTFPVAEALTTGAWTAELDGREVELGTPNARTAPGLDADLYPFHLENPHDSAHPYRLVVDIRLRLPAAVPPAKRLLLHVPCDLDALRSARLVVVSNGFAVQQVRCAFSLFGVRTTSHDVELSGQLRSELAGDDGLVATMRGVALDSLETDAHPTPLSAMPELAAPGEPGPPGAEQPGDAYPADWVTPGRYRLLPPSPSDPDAVRVRMGCARGARLNLHGSTFVDWAWPRLMDNLRPEQHQPGVIGQPIDHGELPANGQPLRALLLDLPERPVRTTTALPPARGLDQARHLYGWMSAARRIVTHEDVGRAVRARFADVDDAEGRYARWHTAGGELAAGVEVDLQLGPTVTAARRERLVDEITAFLRPLLPLGFACRCRVVQHIERPWSSG